MRLHVRHHRTTAPEWRPERTLDLGLDLIFAVVPERLLPDGPTNVIDQRVDAPEGRFGSSHHALRAGIGCQVGDRHRRLEALRTHGFGGLMGRFGGLVRQHHLGAFARQAPGRGQADALSCTGDQRNLSDKSFTTVLVHYPSPSIR
ncbi:hypothetical protein FQZ97_1071320 [compost metagenome]